MAYTSDYQSCYVTEYMKICVFFFFKLFLCDGFALASCIAMYILGAQFPS